MPFSLAMMVLCVMIWSGTMQKLKLPVVPKMLKLMEHGSEDHLIFRNNHIPKILKLHFNIRILDKKTPSASLFPIQSNPPACVQPILLLPMDAGF